MEGDQRRRYLEDDQRRRYLEEIRQRIDQELGIMCKASSKSNIILENKLECLKWGLNFSGYLKYGSDYHEYIWLGQQDKRIIIRDEDIEKLATGAKYDIIPLCHDFFLLFCESGVHYPPEVRYYKKPQILIEKGDRYPDRSNGTDSPEYIKAYNADREISRKRDEADLQPYENMRAIKNQAYENIKAGTFTYLIRHKFGDWEMIQTAPRTNKK